MMDGLEVDSIWVIGAGKFGRRAAIRLRAEYPEARLAVVDRDEGKCRVMRDAGMDAVCMDGIMFLSTGLETQSQWPGWIVPAIPVHVAWLWIKQRLEPEFQIIPVELPDAVFTFLPHGLKGKDGAVYASLADFICPEKCPEPVDRCTVTQKPRPYNLYDRIFDIAHPGVTPIVIQSVRLAPGVGGFSPGSLFESLFLIQNTRDTVILSTACRCHGVLHTFKILPKGGRWPS